MQIKMVSEVILGTGNDACNIQGIKIHDKELSMGVHAFNPSAQEAEEGGDLCV